MALMKCPECGSDISEKAKICPHCGYKNKRFNKKKLIKIILIIIAILAIIQCASWVKHRISIPKESPFGNDLEYFGKTSTMQDVVDTLGEPSNEEDYKYVKVSGYGDLVYPYDCENLSGNLSFGISNNELTDVTWDNEGYSYNTDEANKLVNDIYRYYTEKYGKPDETDSNGQNCLWYADGKSAYMLEITEDGVIRFTRLF